MGRAEETPFVADILNPSKQKLSKPEGEFDVPEYRFDCLEDKRFKRECERPEDSI